MTYSVVISKSVQKHIKQLPQSTQKRVQDKLSSNLVLLAL